MVRQLLVILFLSLLLSACDQPVQKTENSFDSQIEIDRPEWIKDAVIYEVNVRQYTEEGTFEAFKKHLPRLKELGVDILWLMPVHPIGELNRKGELGSYYSVKDYKKVDPAYGSMEGFKSLVQEAHSMGFHVILDWVANHTAWDNPWAEEHPEWYEKTEDGEFLSPFDWTDVIALNYDIKEMRMAMIDALKFWVEEADIDGYRCDVAGEVPVDFWEAAREELDMIKPVFMLAEAEVPEHFNKAFDMNYAWRLHFEVNEVVAGKKPLADLYTYFLWDKTNFSQDGIRMNFIDNHDENSWKGTINSRLGKAQKMAAAFMWTIPGMPLIYSGQEAGLDKSLEFFKKDVIDWTKETDLFEFYQSLNKIKKSNAALWNPPFGGEMNIVSVEEDPVFAFTRTSEQNLILAVFNFSDQAVSYELKDINLHKSYQDLMSGEILDLSSETTIDLLPFGFVLLVMNQ